VFRVWLILHACSLRGDIVVMGVESYRSVRRAWKDERLELSFTGRSLYHGGSDRDVKPTATPGAGAAPYTGTSRR
jgi:hypothetical protein